jgi:hypothetical protein
MFNIGDKVVYPMHGAGVIESIEEKEILGSKNKYYIMRMPIEGMSVMIPIDNIEVLGIRRVVDKRDAERVFEILSQNPTEMNKIWTKLYQHGIIRSCCVSVQGLLMSRQQNVPPKGLGGLSEPYPASGGRALHKALLVKQLDGILAGHAGRCCSVQPCVPDASQDDLPAYKGSRPVMYQKDFTLLRGSLDSYISGFLPLGTSCHQLPYLMKLIFLNDILCEIFQLLPCCYHNKLIKLRAPVKDRQCMSDDRLIFQFQKLLVHACLHAAAPSCRQNNRCIDFYHLLLINKALTPLVPCHKGIGIGIVINKKPIALQQMAFCGLFNLFGKSNSP